MIKLIKNKYITLYILMAFYLPFQIIKSDNLRNNLERYPELTFKYDWRGSIIDFIGSIVFKNKVSASHTKELEKQLPILVKAWEQNAPILFNEVSLFFKKGFMQKTRTAVIYLSNNWSYGSRKFLVLGLRQYLESQPWMQPITKADSFVHCVFHELLHIWLDENLKNQTTLMKKYSKENHQVINHLHLMAIQKMVCQKIKRYDILDAIDEGYRKYSLPEYKRAWEIVNDIEGLEVVLNDILISIK